MKINKNFTSLSYFLVKRYEQNGGTITDFSCAPRPFNSLAFIIKGDSVFQTKTERVKVQSGDMIFIPKNCTYKSIWSFYPKSEYITVHFNFEIPDFLFNKKDYSLQKIENFDIELCKNEFDYIYKHSEKNDFSLCLAMSKFYNICYDFFPNLIAKERALLKSPIKQAVDFIENNYSLDFNILDLAKIANLSQSRFYELFKSEMGYTPTDYKNLCRVKEAVRLLSTNNYKMEEITTLIGYNSSTYFRRVFKKITSKNPKDFKGMNYNL